jgi:shikimate kinase
MDGPHHLVLVGMMGSGKTTVGRAVAARLHRPFFDSDEMIESRQGRTVRDIWLADGEQAYRAMETDVLREALAAPDPAVIAAAGGVVLREENRRLLEDPRVCTVRLDVDPEVLAERVGHQDHRPLLDGDPLTAIRRLAKERAALYQEVADATISAGPRPIADIVEDVLHVVGDGRSP